MLQKPLRFLHSIKTHYLRLVALQTLVLAGLFRVNAAKIFLPKSITCKLSCELDGFVVMDKDFPVDKNRNVKPAIDCAPGFSNSIELSLGDISFITN